MLQQAVAHKPNIPTDMKKPFFPAYGPAIGSFNGLHPKSNFLAIQPPTNNTIVQFS